MGEAFIEYLRELFEPFGAIDARAMFGGHGIYRDGTIFALAIGDAVYLKVDAETKAQFEAAGCAPFTYTAGGTSIPMSYWSVPAAALDSPEEMLPWARLAYAAALRKPAGRKRRSRKR
jgi:DNA transformation protein and related proteins